MPNGRNHLKDPAKAKEIGNRIRVSRMETEGMSQKELGELLGVSQRSVQAYEQGELIPYKFGQKLEDIFGKPQAWFWHGDAAIKAAQDESLDAVLARLDAMEKAIKGLTKAVNGLSNGKGRG